MFVKYVRSSLENLDKKHWLMLLEAGKIETTAGAIKLSSAIDHTKEVLSIYDAESNTHYSVSMYRLIVTRGSGGNAKDCAFDVVTEQDEGSDSFKMAIRDMNRSVERILRSLPESRSEKIRKIVNNKANWVVLVIVLMQLMLILHHVELLFE
nr:MAG TPA: hypothetical protein [Caudoviricetes sp.]